jgi:hypothetical protein
MPLLLENKVVKVDSKATNCKVIHSGERLQVVHAISAIYNVLDVVFDILHQALLLGGGAPCHSPRLS